MLKYGNQHTDMQNMNVNEEILATMLMPMLVILTLILMLLNLNTGYADTDADLCIRIISLCGSLL